MRRSCKVCKMIVGEGYCLRPIKEILPTAFSTPAQSKARIKFNQWVKDGHLYESVPICPTCKMGPLANCTERGTEGHRICLQPGEDSKYRQSSVEFLELIM